jgi:hypothetical protein
MLLNSVNILKNTLVYFLIVYESFYMYYYTDVNCLLKNNNDDKNILYDINNIKSLNKKCNILIYKQ